MWRLLERKSPVRSEYVGPLLMLLTIAMVKDDEYLKNALLGFVVQEFCEDLKKMLGISFAEIRLE